MLDTAEYQSAPDAPAAPGLLTRSAVLGPLMLLVLPVLLMAINTSWILSYWGIDPWVYFGYFTNLSAFLGAFAGTYYGTRLSWIVPGAFVHWLLPAVAANYVLHLGVYYAAVFALYFTLARAVGRRAALLASILTGCYSYFLSAVGWHYVDGAGLAYYSVAIACLTAAIDWRRRRLALLCAGAAFAGAVHTNLVWAAVFPLFGYYYMVSTRESRRGRVLRDWLYMLLGSVLLTLALGVVAVFNGGDFLFFWSSIRFATRTVQRPNAFKRHGTWMVEARWLVFPAVALISTVYFRVVRSASETRLGRLLADHYLAMCASFVAFDVAGGALLQRPEYVSYLIPGMALAVGVQMRAPLDRLSPMKYAVTVGVATAAFTVTLLPSVALRLVPQATYGTAQALLWPFLLLLAALALLRASRNTWAPIAFVMCAGVANVVTVDGNIWTFRDIRLRHNTYRATVAAGRALTLLDPSASARFWYNENSPLGTVYMSIAATRLWGFRLVGDSFPSLSNPLTHRDAFVEPGENLVILTGEDGAFERAEAVLRAKSVSATLVAARDIAEGDVRFKLLFVRTGRDRTDLADAPLPVTSEVFGSGSSKGAAARVALDREGVQITTNRSQYDWQLVSRPIDVAPRRKYLAEFDLQIAAGGAGVHVVAVNSLELLASHYWCKPTEAAHKQFEFDSRANKAVLVALSNCSERQPAVSEYWVKHMAMWPLR